MAPKVSICIPAYKQIEFLRKNLNSIAQQSFTDYEIILSDDSPDNEVEKLLSEFNFGNKLHYYHNQNPLGSPENWNFALKKASGDYIKVMHHDDYFTSSDSLKKYVTLLDNHPESDFGFSATDIYILTSQKHRKHKCSNKELKKLQFFPESLVIKNTIGAPSATIFRRNKTVLFDATLKWLVDIDWYIANLKLNKKIVYTPEELICTIHGAVGQITQSVQKDKNVQLKEHVYMLEKYPQLKNDKAIHVLFELLFHKYGISNLDMLRSIIEYDKTFQSYFESVIKEMNKGVFLKKLRYWMNRYSLNDYLNLAKAKLK